MPDRRRRTPGTAPDIIALIHRLASRSFGPAAIGAQLDVYLADRGRSSERPHANTIEKYARQMRDENSPPWQWSTDRSGHTGELLQASAQLMESSGGKGRPLSELDADRMTRILDAFPTIPVGEALALAREWPAAGEGAIAEYLGFTPWLDGGERYWQAKIDGSVRGSILTVLSGKGFDDWIGRELQRAEAEAEESK